MWSIIDGILKSRIFCWARRLLSDLWNCPQDKKSSAKMEIGNQNGPNLHDKEKEDFPSWNQLVTFISTTMWWARRGFFLKCKCEKPIIYSTQTNMARMLYCLWLLCFIIARMLAKKHDTHKESINSMWKKKRDWLAQKKTTYQGRWNV